MILGTLLVLANIGCYFQFGQAGGAKSLGGIDTPGVELQLPEEFLAGGNITGTALTSPRSVFADVALFKEHLLNLLRANSVSLDQLSASHLTVRMREVYPLPTLSKRFVWAPAHGGAPAHFVHKSVAIDFLISLSHSERITRRAVEESLHRIVAAGPGAWSEHVQGGVDYRRVQSVTCAGANYVEQCSQMCKDDSYLFDVCSNCDCAAEGYQGTASCSCYIQIVHFSGAIFCNSIYAVLMICCGLCCCRGNVNRRPTFEGEEVPNIGDGDFKDGLFSCLDHMPICCSTCCCPIIQPSITYQIADVGVFWKMVLILGIIYAIPAGIGVSCIFPLVICCYRRKLRTKAKMGKDTCMDLLCSCCCTPCVICQEGRHFEEAARVAFGEGKGWKPATDFSSLMKRHRKKQKEGEVVGAPVAVQPTAA